MLPDMTPEMLASLTDSQRINVKIIQNLTSLNTSLNDTQHEVATLNKLVIAGNGDPALMERVRNLESFVGGTKYWLRLVAGALILQTITFGTTAVIFFIRLVPLVEKLTNKP